MCGIAGFYSSGAPLAEAESRLGRMLGAIAHRGPDAEGVYLAGRVALGSRRLAIIDLQGGDQPIRSEDGTISAVYNGEIYNYRELQRELRAAGHRLASQADSETIVHLYEEHGIDLVSRLNGMFAFALWDAGRSTLHLVRDRFGVKPLYYRWDGSLLWFASELKALLKGSPTEARLDLDAFVELFTFQNIISDRSLFAGVSLLPAGSVLTLEGSRLQVRRYWDPLPRPEPVGDPAGLVEELADRFSVAVESHLVADVEVASYLSGGLDTGAITAVAARTLPRLTTFSTGFDVSGAAGLETGFDERADAATLAEQLGTHHHELLLDAHDMEMVLPRLISHLEEPRMSFSYPNYLTAGLASRWVKVVLSGVGGDELFGGYPWRYAIADGSPGFADRYYSYWERLLSRDELAEALEPALAAEVDLDRPRAVFEELVAPARALPELDRILYLEMKTFLHGLLVLEDKLSMAHSLESRVPFLENGLVDFALGVPGEEKVRGGRSKDLFRRALSGTLPGEVVNRGKTGFTPPQAAWFRRDQAAYLERILLSERALGRGLFRAEFLRRVVAEHGMGKADRRLLLWTLLCFEWWQRIFMDGEHPA